MGNIGIGNIGKPASHAKAPGFLRWGCMGIWIVAGSLGCARVDGSAGKDAGPATTIHLPPIADGGVTDRPAVVDQTGTPDGYLTADVAPTGPADAACATQSAMAETLPLDLFVMIDSSGSMTDQTAAGPTKWEAVRTAMTAFFDDPSSAGIGVGLQYFPQVQPNVPALCATNAACGAFGPCDFIRVCNGPAYTTAVACATNSDCGAGATCVLLGTCTGGGIDFCAPAGLLCATGTLCFPFPGNCRARDRCDVPAYATPAVAIATLPGAAPALAASLTMRQPDGLTPTGPAVAGAIAAAQARATANPGHKVVVVLVTDGFPTECTPTDIPAITAVAMTAAAGTPAVPTFVIGVFTPEEAADATINLNALAKGGGTGTAVVIDTNQNVTQVLQTALNQIRTTAVACEYKIPPATGGAIDFGKVNVQFTSGNGPPTTIGHVTGKAACDPTRGGWYYDVDPATGGKPTSIVACDSTCGQFRAATTARVDIVLGCQTIVIL